MPNLRSVLMSAAVVLGMTAIGLATIVVRADVAKLSKLADVIVDATVESKRTELDATGGAIWTIYELRVAETLAGSKRESLTIHVPGGTAGALTQEISGTARLQSGERAVLFLTNEDDRLLVLGQAQGCLRVTTDKKTGALVCRNDLNGLALVGDDGAGVAAEPISMTLEQLRKKVTAALREKADEERLRREAEERRLEELKARALRNAELMRDKPGGTR